MTYKLVDCGNQKKLEYFGDKLLVRPCSQALWKPLLPAKEWERANAQFSRDEGNNWEGKLPESWIVEHEGLKFKIAPTDFGHVGIFPEHSLLWKWASDLIAKKGSATVLNLFAYSGGATLAFAKAGAAVCHVDASQGMVNWARENAALNGLQDKPIRWIVDDVFKFIQREIKRGRKYDGILLDPPSFGRGANGEMFKIEFHIQHLLKLCRDLLSDTPLFFACSNHTSGMTPIVMRHLLEDVLPSGVIEAGEMLIPSQKGRSLPTGCYARWQAC